MNFKGVFFLLWTVAAFSDVPQLTVQGQATLKKPADELILNVGVVTEAEDARSALDENSQKMQKVIAALKKLGLDDTTYETGRFQISPQYTPRPPKSTGDWKPRIEGYQVANSLIVTSSKIKAAGMLIDALSEAGANTIGAIRFGLKNPDMYRGEAIQKATQMALRDAETLAKASHQRLKEILSLSLDQAGNQIKAGPFLARSFESTPIEAGDVEVSASVTVVYEIDSV